MRGDEPTAGEPTLLPEQRVGQAMREAREAAGISLRKLAGQLGYHSHSTLSSYERGAVMPTDEAVAGYQRTLGLVPGTLVDVLESARIERHGDAWAQRRVHIPTEFAPVAPAGVEDSSASSRKSWRPRWWMAAAGGVVVVGVLTLVVGVLQLRSSHPPGPTEIATRADRVPLGGELILSSRPRLARIRHLTKPLPLLHPRLHLSHGAAEQQLRSV
jgi:transcriptional regulator with XRE-family HTH domain